MAVSSALYVPREGSGAIISFAATSPASQGRYAMLRTSPVNGEGNPKGRRGAGFAPSLGPRPLRRLVRKSSVQFAHMIEVGLERA